MKNTTLPLVSAWAFFFVAATISPIFSVQCPYKTPALDRLISAMRGYLRLMLIKILETFVATGEDSSSLLWTKVLRPLAAVCAHPGDWALAGLLLLAIKALQPLAANCAHPGERVLAGLLLLAIKVLQPFSETPSRVREWAKKTLVSMKVPHDETAAMGINTEDLQILLRADELHGNDEVADAALSHAVRQSNLDWTEALEFAKTLVINRLQSQDMFSGTPKLVELGDLTLRALAAVHNVLDYVESCQPRPEAEWHRLPFLVSVHNHVEPECWAFFLRLSASLKQPPTTLPRWLDRCAWDDCTMLGRICQPSNSARVVRSLLALLCRRLERPDFNLSTSVSRLQSFLGVYFGELHIPDSFGADQSRPWSTVLNRESLGPTVAWLTQGLKSDIATPAARSSNDRSRETAWGNSVWLIVKLMAVAEDFSVFGEIPPVAVTSSEILQTFWISCFNYRLHTSGYLVPRGGLDAEGAFSFVLN